MFASRVCWILVASAMAGAAWAAPPEGVWLDQTGRAAITIAPCGDKLCGHITWLKVKLNAAGKPKTDIHNPKPDLQARPLCGLPLLWNFVPDGAGVWDGGYIYDPESGNTYRSTLRTQPDGTLRVRGFVGIELLGRSQVWTPAPASVGHC